MLMYSPVLFMPSHVRYLKTRNICLLGDGYSVEKRVDKEEPSRFTLILYFEGSELDFESFKNWDDPAIAYFIQGTIFRHLIEVIMRRLDGHHV